jgi:uncharacterized protein (DUF1778 family)
METLINDRIDIRISKEQKELIKYASTLRGFKNLSEFVVFCINAEATKIINENNQVLNSIADKKIFLEAILNPPSPNERLLQAKANYTKFIAENESDN